MEKTIGDFAKHLKQLIPVTIPETYPIHLMFKNIADEVLEWFKTQLRFLPQILFPVHLEKKFL